MRMTPSDTGDAPTSERPTGRAGSPPALRRSERRRPGQPDGGRGARRLVPKAIAIFAATGLLTVVVVGLVSALLVRRFAVDQAVDTARTVTQLVGRKVVQPALTDRILVGDTHAIAALDRVVRRDVLSTQIVRVKLWTSEERIVYSDEPRLIGQRYALARDDRRALATGEVIADVSDLASPENRFERPYGKLLEVYFPVRTPRGVPLLFEAYLPFDSVNAAANSAWLRFAPALVAALVALWVLQLPFAASLARRIQRGQREREELLRGALEASDAERRRIAADLHDGVIQDLTGVSYSLAAGAERLDVPDTDRLRGMLRRSATSVRESVRGLRGVLVDIYPPNLHATGLEPAIADLLAPLAARGMRTSLEMPPGLRLAANDETLLYRGAREALRNVGSHSGAGFVGVFLSVHGSTATLRVEDDGHGFSPPAVASRQAEGHVGLRLLGDLARHAGGRLEIDSAPGRGTTVVLSVPVT